MKIRTPDCVKLQHDGARRIRRKLRGMTREQELEYWRRATDELVAECRAARHRLHLADNSKPSR